ncbi:hypothetical protein E2C01_043979 [Portunus trituberculatus]|uniref:Uncharacterized protein n=1 Tax=Portunus trituberculatus TaxID=210409 RepID=A0A5B7FX46_PORTR|nr:hypothetical protein [Portunus trituberculatus]
MQISAKQLFVTTHSIFRNMSLGAAHDKIYENTLQHTHIHTHARTHTHTQRDPLTPNSLTCPIDPVCTRVWLTASPAGPCGVTG